MVAVPSPSEIIGGKYRVERVLGKGGMGVVLSATHLHLRERVAVKVLRPEVSARPEAVARFMREARLSMKLRGEHVIRIFDVDIMGDTLPYFVMEQLDGEDLAMRIARLGARPATEVIDVLLQACEGVAEAHALGIVHRDLKPANLFLAETPNGVCVKVLDFGVSKAAAYFFESDAVTASTSEPKIPVVAAVTAEDDALDLTSTRALLGSPRYMSPEQTRSSRDVDARSDVWALGAIAYEMLAGDPPFASDDIDALRTAIREATPPALADAPPRLRSIVEKCLAKDPARRYRNVAELAEALALLANAPQRSWRIKAAVAVAIAAVGVVYLVRRPQSPAPVTATTMAAPIPSSAAPIAEPPHPTASVAAPVPPSSAAPRSVRARVTPTASTPQTRPLDPNEAFNDPE